MTNIADVIPAADVPNNVEMKTLVNSNFFVLVHEIEEHISHGWRVHPDYAPVANFTHYEVVLRKDLASIKRVQERIDSVLEARGDATKEKQQANIAKAHKASKQKAVERKVVAEATASDMMASIKKVVEGGDEG